MNEARIARDRLRRRLQRKGEIIKLRRVGAPNVDASVLARVTGYQPDELVGEIHQGDRKAILLAEDVIAQGFPLPIQDGTGGDKIILASDHVLNIEAVDDLTRRIAGELIAYELRVRG